MKYWAIIAKENIYEGLHGTASYEIIEAYDFNDACDYAREASFKIMSDYNFIYDTLEEVIQELCEDNDLDFEDRDNPKVAKIISEVYEENLNYEIYELDMEKFPTLNIDTLEEWFYDDPEEFLDKYAK